MPSPVTMAVKTSFKVNHIYYLTSRNRKAFVGVGNESLSKIKEKKVERETLQKKKNKRRLLKGKLQKNKNKENISTTYFKTKIFIQQLKLVLHNGNIFNGSMLCNSLKR